MSPKPPVFAREAFLRHGFDARHSERNRTVGGCRPLKKKKGLRGRNHRKPLIFMVPEIGIEPTTYALRMRRSTN
jgi:hypothetical protein